MTEWHEQLYEMTEYAVERGGLLEVPRWSEHKNGRNWMAKINLEPGAPGGLARDFFEKGGGDYYYVISGLERGDAVEFASDYITWSGKNRDRNRTYAAVESVTKTALTLIETGTAREAAEIAEEIRESDAAASHGDECPKLSKEEQEVLDGLLALPDSRVEEIMRARELTTTTDEGRSKA